jgi:hypothetical protein
MTTAEMPRREGGQEGRREGQLLNQRETVLTALDVRFGSIDDFRLEVESIDNLRRLWELHKTVITANSLNEVRAAFCAD